MIVPTKVPLVPDTTPDELAPLAPVKLIVPSDAVLVNSAVTVNVSLGTTDVDGATEMKGVMTGGVATVKVVVATTLLVTTAETFTTPVVLGAVINCGPKAPDPLVTTTAKIWVVLLSITVAFAGKLLPVMVSVAPGATLVGEAAIAGVGTTGGVTTKEVTLTNTVWGVPGATTVMDAGKAPVPVVVVVTDPPLDNVSVTTVLATKPVPVIVSVVLTGTLATVAVIVGVAASAKAVPELATDDAAGIKVASGAANTVVRLLRSSAAVATYATKLLRSEFKVPSSLGDINCCE
jgi:hypothetical protein